MMDESEIIVGGRYQDQAGGKWQVAGIDGNQLAAKKLDVADADVTTGMSLHLFAQLMTRKL